MGGCGAWRGGGGVHGAEGPRGGGGAGAEITLQRALDAPIDVTLDKVELSEAFKRIADGAHVKLQVDQACYDSLPYGATTKVTATFRATPLRAAIEEILTPLALEQAVSGSTIVIRPSAALERIGRRADWDELKVLETLRTQQLTKLEGTWTEALRSVVAKPQVVVDVAKVDPAVQENALERVRAMLPCPAAQALDAYAAATGMIWTVRTMPAEGQKIIVETPKSWLAQQLQEPVILDFTNARLADVVAELSHASRIRFQPEPGLYLAVPAVSLTFEQQHGAAGAGHFEREHGDRVRTEGRRERVSAPGGEGGGGESEAGCDRGADRGAAGEGQYGFRSVYP